MGDESARGVFCANEQFDDVRKCDYITARTMSRHVAPEYSNAVIHKSVMYDN